MSQTQASPSCRRPLPLSCLLVLVAAASCGPNLQTVSADDLADYLAEGKAGPVFHLIDLRPAEAFGRARLPGARNLPYDGLAADPWLFDDGKPVIFYDDGLPDIGRIEAALGARLPPNVVALAGGFRGWVEAALPLERGTP